MGRDGDGSKGRATVLVNLCWLVPGVVGGSEESVTDALRSVVAQAPTDVELRLAVLEPFLDAHPDLAAALSCEVLPLDGRSKVRRVLAEQFWLGRTARRIGADLVHHAGGVVPLWHPGRIALTVHDLQPLDMPQNFAVAKRLYLRMMIGRSVRVADVVTVPSAFSRDRVVDLLGAAAEKVVVVPWSLRESVSDGETCASPRRRFLLYPAIAYAHKRHRLLVDAFAQASASHPDVDLLLSGGAGPMTEAVNERIAELGMNDRIKVLGRVPAEELETLYREAEAVVIPSVYEGFGLPALEAMSRGCPLLVSDSASLPEVAPPTSVVAADSESAWAAAINDLLSMTEHERAERVSAGRAAARRFSPGRTGQALLSAYRLALFDRPDSEGP